MDPDVLMQTFDRELSLDPVQHQAIARVLQPHQLVIDSAWRTMRIDHPAMTPARD